MSTLLSIYSANRSAGTDDKIHKICKTSCHQNTLAAFSHNLKCLMDLGVTYDPVSCTQPSLVATVYKAA
jgi:hypothetical protein